MTSPTANRPPHDSFKLVTDRWTAPFWEAAARHRLVAPRCAVCKVFRMPPTPFCPSCQSQALDWIELPGFGTVYSYSIVGHAAPAASADALVYVTAVVTLDGAPDVRLITNIVDVPVDAIDVGALVRVVWDDLDAGVSIPRFTLAEPRFHHSRKPEG